MRCLLDRGCAGEGRPSPARRGRSSADDAGGALALRRDVVGVVVALGLLKAIGLVGGGIPAAHPDPSGRDDWVAVWRTARGQRVEGEEGVPTRSQQLVEEEQNPGAAAVQVATAAQVVLSEKVGPGRT